MSYAAVGGASTLIRYVHVITIEDGRRARESSIFILIAYMKCLTGMLQGNEQFRELVDKRKRVYLTARFKREKRLIASSIVAEIRSMDPPGRFLARKGDKDGGVWYDIGDEKAREKASQALRENAPSVRAEIETEIHEQRADMQHEGVDDKEENVHQSEATPAPHPFFHQPAPPPPHHPFHQAYWDWYHHYYGYHSTAQAPTHYPPPPPPSQLQPGPSPALSNYVTNPAELHHAQHSAYWGHHEVPPTAKEGIVDEFKDDGRHGLRMSQDEEDHRLALQLQQEERTNLLEARKERYKYSLARRSNAHYVSSGTASGHAVSHVRRPPPTSQMSTSDRHIEPVPLSQQMQHDQHLAMLLHEREEAELLRSRLTKTSRSMAFPQFDRTSGIFADHSLSESFMAWIHSDSKPKSESTRSVTRESGDQAHVDCGPTLDDPHEKSSTVFGDRYLESQHNASLLYEASKGIIGWGSNPEHISPQYMQSDMEAEGMEVQLRDPNDETTMPPPDPRVQTEWSCKSINSWVPDNFHETHAAVDRDHSLSGYTGISATHSLDMDTSNNTVCIGENTLSHLFEQDESLHRKLRSMPSWERSIRSRSPTLGTQPDHSTIRVRDLSLFKAPPTHHVQPSGGIDMECDD